MSNDDEIKLTTSNNTTNTGTQFPETPRPEVLHEHFSRIELGNDKKPKPSKDNNAED